MYLTGVVEHRELHGAFEVLLQHRPQALVQPGLGVVHREDHRLEFEEPGQRPGAWGDPGRPPARPPASPPAVRTRPARLGLREARRPALEALPPF